MRKINQFFIFFALFILNFFQIFFANEDQGIPNIQEKETSFLSHLYHFSSKDQEDQHDHKESSHLDDFLQHDSLYSLQLEVVQPYQLRFYLKSSKLTEDRLYLLVFLDETADLKNLSQKASTQEKNRSITVAFEQTKEDQFSNLFYKIGKDQTQEYNPFLGAFPVQDQLGNPLLTELSFFNKILIRFSGDGVMSYSKQRENPNGFLKKNEKGEFVFDLHLDPNFDIHRWKFEFGIIDIDLFSGELSHISLIDTVDVSQSSKGKIPQNQIFLQK